MILASALLPMSNLPSRPEFRTSIWLKNPKSQRNFVLLDAILRGFLSDLFEMSFVNQSYIDLEAKLTEFFL